MHKGIVAGRATSAERHYGLEPRPGPATQLSWINSRYWKTHVDDRSRNPKRDAIPAASALTAHTSAFSLANALPLPGSTKGPTWDDTCVRRVRSCLLLMHQSSTIHFALPRTFERL